MKENYMSRPVLGIIETVSLPELGVSGELAKVDTGAYSGAVHCDSIKLIKLPNGNKALKIVPIDPSFKPVIIEDFKRIYARSSSGHRLPRYRINTKIVIQGKEYPIDIGVTNRDKMSLKVLVGRRFIRESNMLVDVTLNQELDNDGGQKI